MTTVPTPFQRFFEVAVSTILYIYFTLGFLLFFVWFYLLAFLFSRDREAAFQKLNHRFYRGFLLLARTFIPGLEIRIDEEIRSIRSSLIVSNHLSYLDPILLISLFPRQRTIVKNKFFDYPVFSWLLRTSGYSPASASGDHAPIMIRNLDSMQAFFASGGNLFIFPEGTRSRDGTLAPFGKGAFTLARKFHAPIHVLRIRNTNRLFPPGRLVFQASERITLHVEHLGVISAASLEGVSSLSEIIRNVRALYLPEDRNPGNPEKLP